MLSAKKGSKVGKISKKNKANQALDLKRVFAVFVALMLVILIISPAGAVFAAKGGNGGGNGGGNACDGNGNGNPGNGGDNGNDNNNGNDDNCSDGQIPNTAPTISLIGANPMDLTVGDVFTDPGATASDAEDGDLTGSISVSGSVDTSVAGAYSVHYSVTDSGSLSASADRAVNVMAAPIVEPTPTQCSDGIDNDADELVDMNDPGCVDSQDNDETNVIVEPEIPVSTQCSDAIDNDGDGLVDLNDPGCVDGQDNDETNIVVENPADNSSSDNNGQSNPVNNGGAGGEGTSNSPSDPGTDSSAGNGEVLGASASSNSEGEVLGASCSPYILSYIGAGLKNNPEDVARLQTFLNSQLGLHLPVTGFFGKLTREVVKAFQLKHKKDVLAPWVPYGLANEDTATGYVYKTTKRMINILSCDGADQPMPQLP